MLEHVIEVAVEREYITVVLRDPERQSKLVTLENQGTSDAEGDTHRNVFLDPSYYFVGIMMELNLVFAIGIVVHLMA